jgi:hypothetical protein
VKAIINRVRGSATTAMTSFTVKGYMPEWPSMPSFKIGRERAFPVHVVHNSGNPEDYFFSFDFDAFFEGSKDTGMFTRPVFHVIAGRDDFDRRIFARQMRESFSEAFEEARAKDAEAKRLAAKAKKREGLGGFDILDMIALGVGSIVSGAFILPLVYLMLGLLGLSAVMEFLESLLAKLKAPFAQKKEASLEEEIEGARGRVDAALANLSITLDWDLFVNAMGPGYVEAHPEEAAEVREQSADGWPLPADIKAHLRYTAKDLA